MPSGSSSGSLDPPPLAIVIPVLDGAGALPACLAALAEGRRGGLVGEIIVADGGSRDGTAALAVSLGARVIAALRGRGLQLAAGGAAAASPWLLFLHADTVLAAGWSSSVAAFVANPANARRAAYFQLRFDDAAPAARRLERIVAWRCRVLGLPYGDQGLLLSRDLYRALGGFRALPLMEDVDLVRRIRRNRLVRLDAVAVTSASRYRRDGYLARSLRNLVCLGLYLLGLPPRLIARLYA
jgi:rSAM/selenodomain-associated transferase 2